MPKNTFSRKAKVERGARAVFGEDVDPVVLHEQSRRSIHAKNKYGGGEHEFKEGHCSSMRLPYRRAGNGEISIQEGRDVDSEQGYSLDEVSSGEAGLRFEIDPRGSSRRLSRLSKSSRKY